MTNFSRLTLATLLMGSLALPALAQGSATASAGTVAPASAVVKHGHAMNVPVTSGKPGVHKVATGSETTAPAPVVKPASGVTTTTVAPSKDLKTPMDAKPAVTGKEAAKDGSVKTPTPTPAIKTN